MQSGVNESVEYGNRLHDVMSRIYRREDVTAAVAGYATEHHLSEEVGQALLSDVRMIVEHPDCSPFFVDDVEIKNECEMVCAAAGLQSGELKSYRADRIVIYDGGVYVVDYKTGRDDSNRRDAHIKQVNRYCDILRQMGYDNVEGYIIYTHNGVKVVKTI